MTFFLTGLVTGFAGLAVFAATLVAILAIVSGGHRSAPLAHANHRSMHAGSTPTSAGVAVIACALAGWFVLGGPTPPLVPIALGAIVLTGISWLDDAETVPAAWRLSAQILASVLAVSAIHATAGPILGGLVSAPVDAVVAVVALVWFINLFNFMDGIDGIAGAEGIAVLSGALLVYGLAELAGPVGGIEPNALPTLALMLVAALSGFMFWNWHPARIFLGDAGAVPIGLLTGAVLFDLAARVSLAAAIILPLAFTVDASLTLVRRLLAGARPWSPHREHLYQRAALADGRHDLFVRRMCAVNAGLIGLAVMAVAAPLAALALAAPLVGWFFSREEARIARSAGQAHADRGPARFSAGLEATAPGSAPSAPPASGGAPRYAGR